MAEHCTVGHSFFSMHLGQPGHPFDKIVGISPYGHATARHIGGWQTGVNAIASCASDIPYKEVWNVMEVTFIYEKNLIHCLKTLHSCLSQMLQMMCMWCTSVVKVMFSRCFSNELVNVMLCSNTSFKHQFYSFRLNQHRHISFYINYTSVVVFCVWWKFVWHFRFSI